MTEREFPGVEHLTREIAGAFAAVKFIAEDGVAEMMKVDADLVGLAGFGEDAQEREGALRRRPQALTLGRQ